MKLLLAILLLTLSVQAQPAWKMALALAANSQVASAGSSFFLVTNVAGSSATTATQHRVDNVAVGDLLILTTQDEQDSGSGPTVTDNVSGTWAIAASSLAVSSRGNAAIFTNIAATGGTVWVTNNWGAADQSGVLFLVRGQATAVNPITLKTNATTTDTINFGMAVGTSGSMIFFVLSDYNSADEVYTYNTAPAYIPLDFNSGSATRGIHGYSTNLSSGTVQTGYSVPGGSVASGACAIVVRPP